MSPDTGRETATPLTDGCNNKCIGDDNTKAAAHRSPNCIRKTKKYVLWNAGISPIAKLLSK